MGSDKKYEETIDRYLRGELEGKELEAFTKEMASDAALRDHVREMEEIIAGIRSNARDSLLAELRKLESSLPVIGEEDIASSARGILSSSAGGPAGKIYLRVLQAVALAACLTGLYFGYGESMVRASRIPAGQREATTPLQAIRQDAGVRGDNDASGTAGPAFINYMNEEYGKTIRILKGTVDKDEEAWILLGNSYYKKKKFRKALDCFSQVNYGPGSSLEDDAKYMLAKCHIALKNRSEAQILLEELLAANNSYSADAAVLLELINKK